MDRIKIIEVGPRDGLQNESLNISTANKAKYIELLGESGIKYIEATSFVRPGIIPQLSDATNLLHILKKKTGVTYAALVPNTKGMMMAIDSGVTEIAVFTAASNSFTKKNTNATIAESLKRIEEVSQLAIQNKIKMRAYVSTIIECPYEGKIQPKEVLGISKKLLDMGVYQISLGETLGRAVPVEISYLLDTLCPTIKPEFLAGHFHDTFGTALSNVFKALEYNLRTFDSSSGGLGGCPYAPGAAGNLATEDLVYALNRSGFETGVDLEKLKKASEYIFAKLGK